MGEHGLALGVGPGAERLGIRAIRLAGLRVDRTAQREGGVVSLAPFQDADVGGAADQVAGRVSVTDQPDVLLAVQPRAFHEIQQLVAAEEAICLGVVFRGAFDFQDVQINVQVHDVPFVFRALGDPGTRARAPECRLA